MSEKKSCENCKFECKHRDSVCAYSHFANWQPKEEKSCKTCKDERDCGADNRYACDSRDYFRWQPKEEKSKPIEIADVIKIINEMLDEAPHDDDEFNHGYDAALEELKDRITHILE